MRTPAVSGHEGELAKQIEGALKEYSLKTDNLGNVVVTIGNGGPHRLIVTSIDQPGYVVSEITEDGFLRVQRLPQTPPNPTFDSLYFAQPIWVMTRSGKRVGGVFAGLSVHLSPRRMNPPKMNHLDEMYIDIGAKNAPEVRGAEVDILDPVSLNFRDYKLGDQVCFSISQRNDSLFSPASLRAATGVLAEYSPFQLSCEGRSPEVRPIQDVRARWVLNS